jgi:Ice-binding-like
VFWQVGSSATLGTTSSFKGPIMALTSIAVQTGALVQGRALARNGAVTLDNDTFTAANCGTTPPHQLVGVGISSSPFTPGPGLSGDRGPGGGSPLKRILLGVALVVLGVAVAMSVQPLRRRGSHS